MAIPKKIHCCWFSGDEKPPIITKCIDSWREFLPDYEIIEWNGKTFDYTMNDFVEKSFNTRKWARVSDYFRLWVLYNHGGIFLDTDIQAYKSFNDFLENKFFIGFEKTGYLAPHCMGSEKKFELFNEIMQYYEKNEINFNDRFDNYTSPKIFTKFFCNKFPQFRRWSDINQVIDENIRIYSSPYLSYRIENEINYAIHHFCGSWVIKNGERKSQIESYVNNYFRDKKFHRRVLYRSYQLLDDIHLNPIVPYFELILS